MIKTEWDELYVKVYQAYDYSALKNEQVRESLGTLLDTLIDNKPQPTN
jgi:hypothetical protein